MKISFSKVVYKIGKYSRKRLEKLYNKMPQSRKDRVDSVDNDIYKEFLIVEFFVVTKKLKSKQNEDFLYNDMGKPYFKDSKIKFNISHSENLLIIVFSKNDIGVDLQHDLPFDESFAKNICNDKELEIISTCKNKNKIFTLFWTQKESVVKLLGTTLYVDIKYILNDIEKYKIKSFLSKDFVFSVCVKI